MTKNLVRPMNKKELAYMYGVSRNTMNSWLKPHLERIGKQEGYIYTPKQVKIIFEILGRP